MKHDTSPASSSSASGTAVHGRGVAPLLVLAVMCFSGAPAGSPERLLAADAGPPAEETYLSRMFITSSDGLVIRKMTDLPEYGAQGSPDWSDDGRLMAFEAYKTVPGATPRDCVIGIVNADGSHPRIFVKGALPCLSPLGNRVAFSRYAPDHGVWVMSTEGPDKELVQIDELGWGADWAPDGRLAYTKNGPGGSNIVIFDIVEGRRDLVFDEQNTPYNRIFWNIAWSPDNKRIAFRGTTKDGKHVVAIVDVRGEKFGLVHRAEGNFQATLAWSPDGKRILMIKQCPERNNRLQVYYVDPDTNDPPQLLPAQAPDRDHHHMCYSPDGTQLGLCSMRPPAPKPAAAPLPAEKNSSDKK